MKDLYSFHIDAAELDEFYEQMCAAYMRVFHRCGIGERTVRTFASGGVFSRFSDEFQMLCDAGEDTIFASSDRRVAINAEVASDLEARRAVFGDEHVVLTESRAIEVGNTFKLGTRFSDACDLAVADSNGVRRSLLMCSYGIGTTRLVGSVAEVCNDDRGLLWPEEIAPYDAHVIVVGERARFAAALEQVSNALSREGLSILVDDRDGLRAGEKFADADLLGIPYQVILGERMSAGHVEVKIRRAASVELVAVDQLGEALSSGRLGTQRAR